MQETTPDLQEANALRANLATAEIRFAWFNAQRTAPGAGEGIQHRTNAAFEILRDPSRPTSAYYNRAVARVGAALTADVLDELPAELVAIETTPLHVDAATSARLIERGFTPGYQLCYLGIVPAGQRPVMRDVERLDATGVDLFFDLLQMEGVDFPAEKRAAKRGYYCTRQFRAYIVRDQQRRVCGWTTMFVDGTTAFFGNSFTLPAFRRTGVHAALLAARLNEAASLGLAAAFTDVEFGSQSHLNCERAGLQMLTVNTIWTRAA